MSKEDLAKVIVIGSWIRKDLRFKVKARQGRVDTIRTLFKAVFIAKVILEGHNTASPIDGRVVSLEPIYPEDNGVILDFGNVQGYGFMVGSYGKGNLHLVGDRTMRARVAVSHVESNRVFKGGGGKIVAVHECSINE